MNHPSNKHDKWSLKKLMKREDYKKSGPSVLEIVKNQLEVVEVEDVSLFTQIFSLHYVLTA